MGRLKAFPHRSICSVCKTVTTKRLIVNHAISTKAELRMRKYRFNPRIKMAAIYFEMAVAALSEMVGSIKT